MLIGGEAANHCDIERRFVLKPQGETRHNALSWLVQTIDLLARSNLKRESECIPMPFLSEGWHVGRGLHLMFSNQDA
jgi:hypothetical protein